MRSRGLVGRCKGKSSRCTNRKGLPHLGKLCDPCLNVSIPGVQFPTCEEHIHCRCRCQAPRSGPFCLGRSWMVEQNNQNRDWEHQPIRMTTQLNENEPNGRTPKCTQTSDVPGLAPSATQMTWKSAEAYDNHSLLVTILLADHDEFIGNTHHKMLLRQSTKYNVWTNLFYFSISWRRTCSFLRPTAVGHQKSTEK
ncbi:hypothetical protein BS17DRAFT_134659 [Gyrodon lividus]|nr:hypothetical protein BS17DRAFT_134659 [Gyrodon lividus]